MIFVGRAIGCVDHADVADVWMTSSDAPQGECERRQWGRHTTHDAAGDVAELGPGGWSEPAAAVPGGVARRAAHATGGEERGPAQEGP